MVPTCLTKQIASRESLQDRLVRLGVDVATFCDMWGLKQPELMPSGNIKIFEFEDPAISWLPTSSYPSPFYRTACGIDYLVK